MSKINYLYLINLKLPTGDYSGIFSSNYSFDINLDLETFYTYNDIYNSFMDMIFSDPAIFVTGPEDYFINDINIVSKIEYKLSYNKLLPDNLYKSLSWFNNAMRLYETLYIEEYDDTYEEEKVINTIKDTIEKAYTDKIFRYFKTDILKESAFCGFSNRFLEDKMKRIQHAEAVLTEIIKEIEIESIKSFDTYIHEYELSHNTEIQEYKTIKPKIKLGTEEISLASGHWPYIIPFTNPKRLKEYKINLLFHIGMFVSEIRLIFTETLDSVTSLKPFYSPTNYLPYERFEDVFLYFKTRLIKEKKKYIIENQDYSISLFDLKKEKTEHVNDKATILSSLSSNFKKQEKITVLLNDIDEHYYISNSVKFPKRQLAIIAFILQHCELFNKMSYESFKQNICWYFGKENISMKPNKIKNEAIQEYYKKEFLYKKYNITIKEPYKSP